VVIVALVVMEVGHVCGWCEIVEEDDGCCELVEVKGLWYQFGETGRLSSYDELVLVVVVGTSSSDMREYCN